MRKGKTNSNLFLGKVNKPLAKHTFVETAYFFPQSLHNTAYAVNSHDPLSPRCVKMVRFPGRLKKHGSKTPVRCNAFRTLGTTKRF